MTVVLGLIVNPVAGLGGRVALKGSDGPSVQSRARALGARPRGTPRATAALAELAARTAGPAPARDAGPARDAQPPGRSRPHAAPADPPSPAPFSPSLRPGGAPTRPLTGPGTAEAPAGSRCTPDPTEPRAGCRGFGAADGDHRGAEPAPDAQPPGRSRPHATPADPPSPAPFPAPLLVPEPVRILTAGGAMGEDAARAAGVPYEVVYHPETPTTRPADTAAAVRALVAHGASLILFAGGDGTARDIHDALPATAAPAALGIPTGVKMHSAVFAVTPRAAGEVAAAWAAGRTAVHPAEVMDRDEDALRAGRVSAALHGWLDVPRLPARVQARKTGAPPADPASAAGLAAELAQRIADDPAPLVLGPGSTARAVAEALGEPRTTLTGVDVLHPTPDGPRLLDPAADADVRADRLEELHAPWVALSPIGGQGFLLGRGNQQLTPELLRTVPRERLLVLCTEAKLAELGGRPLLVDTGDPALDERLTGPIRVITGRGSTAMYRLTT